MPRKKLSPSNRSEEDENISDDIDSDSSLELNSRRNTFRKKAQRRYPLRQNQNNFPPVSTEKRKNVQENSSEKNEKRPPIIKIFRRIDRKAKHIYLVDDKIEDRNELLKSPEAQSNCDISNTEKSPHSLEATSDQRPLLYSCVGQVTLTECTAQPTTIERNYREHVFEEHNVWNLPGNLDTSRPSNQAEIGVWYQRHELEESQSSAASIAKQSDQAEIDVDDQHHSINNLSSPSTAVSQTSDRDDDDDDSCETSDLSSPGTDYSQTPDRDDKCNKPCETHDLYSPVTDVSQTPDIDNWNQPCETDILDSSVADVTSTLCNYVAWNQLCKIHNLYSPLTEVDQTSGKDEETDGLDSQKTDIDQKPDEDIAWNKPRDNDTLYPSDTDVDQTPGRSQMSSQLRSSDDYDYLNSSVTKIEPTSRKTDTFGTLYSDPSVSSDDDFNALYPSDTYIDQTYSRHRAPDQ